MPRSYVVCVRIWGALIRHSDVPNATAIGSAAIRRVCVCGPVLLIYVCEGTCSSCCSCCSCWPLHMPQGSDCS